MPHPQSHVLASFSHPPRQSSKQGLKATSSQREPTSHTRQPTVDSLQREVTVVDQGKVWHMGELKQMFRWTWDPGGRAVPLVRWFFRPVRQSSHGAPSAAMPWRAGKGGYYSGIASRLSWLFWPK